LSWPLPATNTREAAKSQNKKKQKKAKTKPFQKKRLPDSIDCFFSRKMVAEDKVQQKAAQNSRTTKPLIENKKNRRNRNYFKIFGFHLSISLLFANNPDTQTSLVLRIRIVGVGNDQQIAQNIVELYSFVLRRKRLPLILLLLLLLAQLLLHT
jgi:hypothetical protein